MTKKKTGKKNNKKKIQNKKTKLWIVITIILIALLLGLVVLIISPTKVECSKTISEHDFKIETKTKVIVKKNNINKILVTKKISVLGNSEIDYLSMVRSSMEKMFKEDKINYTIKQEDGTLIVNITYTEPKKYIIDDIFLEKEENGISFNVLKEDNNGIYATFDLSKKYEKAEILKILQKANYVCK